MRVGLIQALGPTDISMNAFFGLVFLAAFLSMVIVYPMYFLELSNFKKIILRDHADLIRSSLIVGKSSDIDMGDAYKILQRVKDNHLDGVVLSPDAATSSKYAKRLLYLGMSLFMLVLFLGLAESLISKGDI